MVTFVDGDFVFFGLVGAETVQRAFHYDKDGVKVEELSVPGPFVDPNSSPANETRNFFTRGAEFGVDGNLYAACFSPSVSPNAGFIAKWDNTGAIDTAWLSTDAGDILGGRYSALNYSTNGAPYYNVSQLPNRKLYVGPGDFGSRTPAPPVDIINAGGSFNSQFTPTSGGSAGGWISAIAGTLSRDGAIFYYNGGRLLPGFDNPIRRWDVVGATNLSDFNDTGAYVGTIANYQKQVHEDIDGNLLTRFDPAGVSPAHNSIRLLDTSGTVLLDELLSDYIPRATATYQVLAIEVDPFDSDHFWILIRLISGAGSSGEPNILYKLNLYTKATILSATLDDSLNVTALSSVYGVQGELVVTRRRGGMPYFVY